MLPFWMKVRLMKKDLWYVVNTGPTVDEKQQECEAFNLLVKTISESISSRDIDATSAKDFV